MIEPDEVPTDDSSCCPSGWQCRYNPANGASQNNRVCVAVVTAVPEAQPGAGSNGGGGGGTVNTVVRTNIVTVTGQPAQGGGGQQQPVPTAQPQPQGGGGVVYYTTVIQGPSASIGVVMSTTYIVDGNAATTVVTIWGGKFAWKNSITPCGQNTNAPTAISGAWIVGCSATDYNAATPGKTLIVPGALGPIFAVLIVLVTAITLWI